MNRFTKTIVDYLFLLETKILYVSLFKNLLSKVISKGLIDNSLLSHNSILVSVHYSSIKLTGVIMANDKDWQSRTDEWVNSINKSRLKKEQELLERNKLSNTDSSTTDTNSSSANSTETPSATHKK